VIEPLSERILGRVALDDIIDPVSDKLIVEAGELIDEVKARAVDESNVESVMIRSVLTCEAKNGVCAKCYGRNLATNTLVNQGEAVGIVAAQSIGEPGTQLTLRTFHIGGTASHVIEESHQPARYEGQVSFSENLHISENEFVEETTKQKYRVVLVRNGKMSIIDSNNRELISYTVPQGAKIYVNDGQQVEKSTVLYDWDVYNEHIVSRYDGYVKLIDLVPGVTYDEVSDASGFKEWQIIASKDRDKTARILIVDEEGNPIGKAINLPESSSLLVKDGQKVRQGETMAKRSKETARSNDITGGLPRVSELFEARNPSNEAIVSEVNGYVQFDRLSKGIQTVRVRNDLGEMYTYKIPPGKHILVHDGDYIHAGNPICDGAIPPKKILKINGVYEVQKYLVNEIQHVYRLQGVRINDKHIEVIVRQMLQKVEVSDPGDTDFLTGDRVSKQVVMEENEKIYNMVRITDSGDTALKNDNLYPREIVEEDNERHKSAGKKPAEFEPAVPATFEPLLLGITRASLNTESWISAASFQETTRVLTDAAVAGKVDYLKGLKENIIMGRLIPAGTGQSRYENLKVREPEFTEVDDLEFFADAQVYDDEDLLIE
jgi:DNA-directed RNA polymerase subunit beta'